MAVGNHSHPSFFMPKRIISVLLTLTLLLGIIPNVVFAAGNPFDVLVGETQYNVTSYGDGYAVLVPNDATTVRIRQIEGYPYLIYNTDYAIFSDGSSPEDAGFIGPLEGATYSDGVFEIPLSQFDNSGDPNYPRKLTFEDDSMNSVTLFVGFSSGANTLPVLVHNQNTTLYVKAGDAFEISLVGIFRDADGDTLTYKYSSVIDGNYTSFDGTTYRAIYSGIESTLFFKANDGTDDSEDVYTVYLKTVVDKTELNALVKQATQLDASGYYTSGDCWNGQQYDTSKKGFWALMQAALSDAQNVCNNDAASESVVEGATTKLTNALANLIPKAEVNATVLYEVKRNADGKVDSQYTAATWTPFAEAKAAAETMLAALYDENGNATEINWGPAKGTPGDDAITQKMVDAAATVLTQAQGNLCLVSSYGESQNTVALVSDLLPKLIAQANRAAEADYTAESWASFQTALIAANAATAPTLTGTWADKAAAAAYQKVYDDLYDAYYYRLVTANKFTVDFEVTDNSNARTNTPATGVLESAEMDAGSTLNDLVAKYAVTKHSSKYAVMINGVLVGKSYLMPRFEVTLKTGNPTLHPGDQVCLIPTFDPRSTLGATLGTIEAAPWQYLDSVKQTNFKTDADITAEAGKAFTVSVEEAYAYLGAYTGSKTPASGMTLFLSEPQAERGGKVTTTKLSADGAAIVTDANGSASLTVYREGWYLLQAYDLTEDEIGNQPNYTDEWSKGTYHSVNSGASVWVHITASSNPAAVKTALQNKLDQVYQAYPESYFRPETWTALKNAYTTGKNRISSAASTGDAYDAQQTAIIAIRKLQDDTTAENEKNLKTFRTLLHQLPDDVTLITSSVKPTVDALLSCYNGMSSYQRSQITGEELEKYNAIAAAAGGNLPAEQNYTLTLKIEGDTTEATTALNNMAAYFRENPAKQDAVGGATGQGAELLPGFTFHSYVNRSTATVTEAAPLTQIRLPIDVDYMAYYYVRNSESHTVSGNGWEIKDEGLSLSDYGNLTYNVDGDLTVKIGGKPYEIKSIRYQGIETRNVSTGAYTTMDYSTYLGKDRDSVNMRFADAYAAFTMPYKNVTVTITWGPVATDAEKLATAKANAISVVDAAYNDYLSDPSQYDDAGKAALKAARDTFKKAMEADDLTIEAVNTAKSKALADMASVPKIGETPISGKASFDSGTKVGTVTVSMENTTFADGDFTGTIFTGRYDLGENDTMMTMVLKALEIGGYKWNGYETLTSDSYTKTTYIASISKDGKSLGEFSGGKQSGWMGTLNDWMVNEGFAQFGYTNGKLKDGDVIRVMYTTTGLGLDLGASWENTDTSLKALSATGGELSPTFSGSTTDYVLVLPVNESGTAANIKLFYTAANKNYQARMYLNTYLDETQRYSNGEFIPVTPGDVVYIGIGETAWPTMNTYAYTGKVTVPTKYTVQVIQSGSVSDAAAMIEELPEVGQLTLADAKAVRTAGGLYDSLKQSERDDLDSALVAKLKKCRAKITDMEAANVVSQLLQSLPSKLTIKDKETVHSASDAYNALTTAQKKYLTAYEESRLASAISEMSTLEVAYVDGMLANLPGKDAVTAQSRATIEAARAAYKALTTEQQEQIQNLDKLLAAEEALNNLGSTAIYEDYLRNVLAYVKKEAPNPSYGYGESVGTEWAILAEARGNVNATVWYDTYLSNTAAAVAALNGNLDQSPTQIKRTEYSRLILALTALGEDATEFTGSNGRVYNLVSPLFDKTSSGTYRVSEQGNNGTAFALIALDSGNYYDDDTGNTARNAWLNALCRTQLDSGAWGIDGEHAGADVDATAMVIQALAPYRATNSAVAEAIEKALTWLSQKYQTTGDYGSSESAAQVIVALSALNIDAKTDSRFQYKGISVLSNFLSYADETTGGFLHVKVDPSTGGAGTVNQMSSEQAAYTLVAYDRYVKRTNSLYDMTDVVKREDASAQEVIDMINQIGNVDESSYNAIAEARNAYNKLSAADKAKVKNYNTLTAAETSYKAILKQKQIDQYKALKAHYDDLLNDKTKKYGTAAKKKLASILQQAQTDMNAAESCERVTAIYEKAITDLDAVKPGDIEVTFRLIGALEATQDVDLTTDSYLPEYVTWVPTKTYALQENATVYDLFTEAMSDAGLRYIGAESNYVSTIYAPSCLGGYALSEFTNGKKSGWMYTVNGKHPNQGLKNWTLNDNDVVVWHYVNDYSHEVADWFNDPNYPSLGNGTYYNDWLRAADISPEQYVNELLGKILKVGKNGTVEPKLTFQHIGKSVTFTFKPDTGYKVKDVKVNGKSVGAVKTYTIDKLTVSTRIEVEFTNGKLPFTDVRESDWFYKDVAFAYENGLFAGTSDTTFSPNASMTRAMLVTVLYRLEGQPAVNGRSGFSDVQYNGYYEDAVTWAADNGIVNGTSTTTFSPNANVTREQMAAILYRYAQHKKYNTAASSGLNGFTDHTSVSGYAAASLEWAVAEKLVNGSAGKLMPTGNATRAQVAAILHRFVENVAKTTK